MTKAPTVFIHNVPKPPCYQLESEQCWEKHQTYSLEAPPFDLHLLSCDFYIPIDFNELWFNLKR